MRHFCISLSFPAIFSLTTENRFLVKSAKINNFPFLQVVLSLNHLQGAFLILLIGTGSGVLLLILEFFLGRVLGVLSSAARSASSDVYKSSFSQGVAAGGTKPRGHPACNVTSGFNEKGDYVIRAVLKGS